MELVLLEVFCGRTFKRRCWTSFIYDNLARGEMSHIKDQLEDPRCEFFKGDLRETDLLNTAMEGCDYVIHLAAMWLLHYQDYPRTAFDVNIQGTFNVLEACKK